MILADYAKGFLMHYNFPPFSTGEAKRYGSPGRREIGHGNLAERALTPVLPPDADFLWDNHASRLLTFLLAVDPENDHVLGAVMGVDHKTAFGDPERGTSLWALAADPQASVPGIGQALVRQLIEHYQARARAYMDLSVMHDNSQAIRLYQKLGFERVPGSSPCPTIQQPNKPSNR